MGKSVFLFPGQGAQSVGMMKELAAGEARVREVLEEADQVLGFSLSGLMFEGPEEELKLTRNAQPALVAAGVAVLALIREKTGLMPDYVAGHSLGEYAAICAAGGFSFADAVRLVHLRGKAMQEAVPVGEGSMAALLGLEKEVVESLCREAAEVSGGVCVAANFNGPGQIVISGHVAAVEQAVALAKEQGGKRSVMLPVSAPFHSPLMAPAAQVMAEALAGTDMRDLAIPLIANVNAREVREAAVVRDQLVAQVTGAVLWEESMGRLRELGVEHFVEVGWGKVLTGLMRRIDRQAKAFAINDAQSVVQLSEIQ